MHVRYYVPDENGSTRQERNLAAFEDGVDVEEAPPIVVDDMVRHIWDWYFALSNRLRRVRDGVCEPIEPVQFRAWVAATHEIVRPREYAILGAMDLAYCAETNAELAAYRARQEDARKHAAKE